MLSSATFDSFALATQTSWDAEVGARWSAGRLTAQASAWRMNLRNELHFNAGTFLNENLPPTRRDGLEANARITLTPTLALDLNAAWIQARFRNGDNAGRDVPLVAARTGAAAIRWEARTDWFLTTTAAGVGPRWMDNDDANTGVRIPGHTLVNLKLAGRAGPWTVSAQVNNALGAKHVAYAVASANTPTTYNAYPLPARSFRLELGRSF